MATSYANIDSLGMGKLLDIIFTKGVRDQLPQNFAEFDLIKALRVPGNVEREIRYQIQTGRGPARVQAASPGVAASVLPASQPATIAEIAVKMKKYEANTTISADLFSRLKGTSNKAAEELAIEMEATTVDLQRRLCADLYNDGSGVVVRINGSVTEVKGDSTNVDTVTCTAHSIGTVDTFAASGSITFLEPGDILVAGAANGAGTAVGPTGTATDFYGWQIDSVDVDAGTFVVKPINSSLTKCADVTASNLADNVSLYRVGDAGNLMVLSSVSDWAVASNYMLGLESMTAIDGRTVAGMTMSGLLAGSRYDCGGDLIDTSDFQKVISLAKRRVGAGGFKWDSGLMSFATLDALIESREADRRFVSLEDTVRGGKKFGYQHGNDFIEFVVSEFCPRNRVYILPKGGKQGKAIGMHFRDAEHLKGPDGGAWHLNVNGNGRHINSFSAYHNMLVQMSIYQPASVAVLTNFLNA
jgi:hypothetical protein